MVKNIPNKYTQKMLLAVSGVNAVWLGVPAVCRSCKVTVDVIVRAEVGIWV